MESLDDMILFAAVADAGSFTQASAKLGVPKSTISQRIAQLEERLGLRLLNRSTRRVSLTNSGLVFVEHCRRARSEAEAAKVAMLNLKNLPSGTIKVTCPEVTASYFMPRFLHGFGRQFPNITIELISTNENLDLVREGIDFAFRVGDVPGKDLIVRKISAIRRVMVAAPGYLKAKEPIDLPQHVERHRCLVHQAHPIWHFQSGTTKIKVSPPCAVASNSISFLLQASLEQDGIAILPAYVCRRHLLQGDLLELLPQWKVPPHQMIMVSPNGKNLSMAQAAFRRYVAAFDFSVLSTGKDADRKA
jgi:DNA-binding transcriptional LysR family regulator